MANQRKQPRSLKRLLDDFVDTYPHKVALKRGMILSQWSEVIGASVREQVRDIKFQGSKLILFVEDTSWRHEIHMQRHIIAKKLNQIVNEEIVREIIVKS